MELRGALRLGWVLFARGAEVRRVGGCFDFTVL